MFDVFYILHPNPTWYMLIIRDTHFCISCGDDLNKILNVLKRYVKEYKTKDKLLKAMRKLDGQGKVSPATYEQRETAFREHGHEFKDLINKTVEEAINEARVEEKTNSPLYKAKTRLKKAGGVVNVSIEEMVATVEPVRTPAIIKKKPRLIKVK